MNIIERSDIQLGNSRVYLNNWEQGTNLFFKDNNSKQYYILMREEEVIATGVLKGFKEGSQYSYRFDFLNFIKIYNQEVQPHTIIDEFGSYRFEGDNTCNLYFYLSPLDLLENNVFNNILIVQPDGKIMLNREEKTYEDVIASNKAFITFVDAGFTDYDTKGYELQYRLETQGVAERGSYMPITMYRNNIVQYEFLDIGGNSIYMSDTIRKGFEDPNPGINDGYILSESDGFTTDEMDNFISLEIGMRANLSDRIGYMTLMVMIPTECHTIKIDLFTKESTAPNLPYKDRSKKRSITLQAFDRCLTPYYFWNENGAYDTVYCSGVFNKVIDVEKEYINVNGRQIPLKITSVEKIKHNTGLALKQEQIYSLIRSPQVNHITTVDGEPSNSIYNIDLESFEGYNGINLSERNLELIFSKPMESKRVTNKKLNFFD